MAVQTMQRGGVLHIAKGDHFAILLPDGTMLQVECTNDDFSIVRGNGLVAYEKPISESAMRSDGVVLGDQSQQTTGRN